MPSTAAIVRDLAAMRSGHGSRRAELRAKLMDLDPSLRRERNVEAMRVAQLRHQLTTGARVDHAALQAATNRLAALDQEIARRIAAEGEVAWEPVNRTSRRRDVFSKDRADPAEVNAAKAAQRGRLC